ncbi:hypothetical protein Q3G72_029854 [Acer saccharum]|nr:hypothetical protein Q3G72_029854 [Acer saccharum]
MSSNNYEVSKPINVELDGSNYIFWSQCMEDYLNGRGLWEIVDGSETQPADTDVRKLKEWKMNNSKIVSWIRSTCKTSVALSIGMSATPPFDIALMVSSKGSGVFGSSSSSKSTGKKPFCVFCRKPGHWKQDCLHLQRRNNANSSRAAAVESTSDIHSRVVAAEDISSSFTAEEVQLIRKKSVPYVDLLRPKSPSSIMYVDPFPSELPSSDVMPLPNSPSPS